MPADENNTPSAATGSDPDSITPGEILATKNTLEAQKRHAKEAAAEAAATLAGMGRGTAGGAHLPAGAMQTSKQFSDLQKTIGSIAPFQPPAYNGASALVQPSSVPGAVGYQSGASYSEATRAWNDEVTKTRIVFSRKSVPAEADATQYLGLAITNFGLEPGFHVAARLEASATTSVAAPVTAVIEYRQRAQRANCPTGRKPCDWAHQQRRCARQYGDHV
jgi:hypothetical protein